MNSPVSVTGEKEHGIIPKEEEEQRIISGKGDRCGIHEIRNRMLAIQLATSTKHNYGVTM